MCRCPMSDINIGLTLVLTEIKIVIIIIIIIIILMTLPSTGQLLTAVAGHRCQITHQCEM